MAGIGAVMDGLMSIVTGVGESLYNAFSNPKQALTDLFEFIKGQFINRFEALITIVQKLSNLEFV